jgi:hypothetical protein
VFVVSDGTNLYLTRIQSKAIGMALELSSAGFSVTILKIEYDEGYGEYHAETLYDGAERVDWIV